MHTSYLCIVRILHVVRYCYYYYLCHFIQIINLFYSSTGVVSKYLLQLFISYKSSTDLFYTQREESIFYTQREEGKTVLLQLASRQVVLAREYGYWLVEQYAQEFIILLEVHKILVDRLAQLPFAYISFPSRSRQLNFFTVLIHRPQPCAQASRAFNGLFHQQGSSAFFLGW